MSELNAATIRPTDIQDAYCIAVDTYTSTPDAVAAGFTPEDTAIAAIEKTLRDIKHPMAGNAGTLMKSRAAAMARKKHPGVLPQAGSKEALALVTKAMGFAPNATTATASPATATTPDAATARTTTAPAAGEQTDHTAINTLVELIVGAQMPLATILAASERTRDARVRAEAATTEEDDAFAFASSGLGALPVDHSMVGAVDALLATVAPGTTWAGIIGGIANDETAIEAARKTARARRLEAERASIVPTPVPAPVPVDVAEVPASWGSAPNHAAIERAVGVVERKARDVFPQVYGAGIQLLEFQIPTLAFPTPHPDVPAIDSSYKFFMPVLVEALQTIVDNEILWLYGDSGCGKSEFWKQISAYLGMPFTRLNMDGHLTRGDIIGVNRMVPNANRQMEMRFVDGILPRAMARPGLLLIDELDLGDPEIMAVLQPVLEGEPLRILEDHGRVVTPHPLFRIAVTGNTIGLGSSTNAYVNAFEQSAATRDRIAAYVKMPYLTPDMEKTVLMERMPGADEAFLDKLIQLANKVREGYAQGSINQIFSMRSTQAAVRRYVRFKDLYPNPRAAIDAILEAVVLNRMDTSSRNTTVGLIDNIFA